MKNGNNAKKQKDYRRRRTAGVRVFRIKLDEQLADDAAQLLGADTPESALFEILDSTLRTDEDLNKMRYERAWQRFVTGKDVSVSISSEGDVEFKEPEPIVIKLSHDDFVRAQEHIEKWGFATFLSCNDGPYKFRAD